MDQQAQMVPIQLGQQGGVDPRHHIRVNGHQFSSGVIRKPQAWPPSNRQCTRST